MESVQEGHKYQELFYRLCRLHYPTLWKGHIWATYSGSCFEMAKVWQQRPNSKYKNYRKYAKLKNVLFAKAINRNTPSKWCKIRSSHLNNRVHKALNWPATILFMLHVSALGFSEQILVLSVEKESTNEIVLKSSLHSVKFKKLKLN